MTMSLENKIPRIFISYAHNDNESNESSNRWLDRLLEHLAPLNFQAQVLIWSDQDLEIGSDWNKEIYTSLQEAVAAILLVSPAFLASEYIRNNELPVLLKNAQNKGVVILPIIVRPSLFQETNFRYPDPKQGPQELSLSVFQTANSPDEPLNGMNEKEQDNVFVSVAKRLLEIINSHQKTKPDEVKPHIEVQTLQGHTAWIRSLAFPNGTEQKILVSGSNDNTVRLWNLDDRNQDTLFLGHAKRVKCVGISSDGQTVVSGSADDTIKLWERDKRNLLRTITPSSKPLTINYIPISHLSNVGDFFASGHAHGKVKLWHLETGDYLRTIEAHSTQVRSLAISRDGRIMASGSEGHKKKSTINLWSLSTDPQEARTIHYSHRKAINWAHLQPILSLAISPDNQFLVSGSADTTIKVWRLDSRETRPANYILYGHSAAVLCIAISSNGQLLASASADGTIKIWSLQRASLLDTLNGHSGAVRAVAFSRDGQLLASGGDDNMIKVWRLPEQL